jgi:hypothetical protein
VSSINDPKGIDRFRLVTLRSACRLERLGMGRSRRPSARTITINEFKLAKSATWDEVIGALDKRIQELT